MPVSPWCRGSTIVGMIFCVISVVGLPMTASAATSFADPTFQQQWQQGEAITPNFWGPLATARDGGGEPYQEAPGGQRLIQYFDKARMELNNPSTGTVTSGLLATEMITGNLQLGDSAFKQLQPAGVPVAGDPDNTGPTYAAIGSAQLTASSGSTPNAPTSRSLSADGTVGMFAGGASDPQATIAAYDADTQHNVAAAFAAFRDKVNLLNIGFAISEPFWSNVKVAGTQKDVLVQAFQRRVLTYTPSNPDPFKVEFGNIGQHYYRWRYSDGSAPGPPPGGGQSQAGTPPLAAIPFPTQAVAYPDSWPTEIHFPTQFAPVEVSATPTPDSSSVLYIAKLRFQGPATAARDQISGFLSASGWQATPADLGGGAAFVMVSKNNGQSSGFYVVDPDPDSPGATRIVVTISL